MPALLSANKTISVRSTSLSVIIIINGVNMNAHCHYIDGQSGKREPHPATGDVLATTIASSAIDSSHTADPKMHHAAMDS